MNLSEMDFYYFVTWSVFNKHNRQLLNSSIIPFDREVRTVSDVERLKAQMSEMCGETIIVLNYKLLDGV